MDTHFFLLTDFFFIHRGVLMGPQKIFFLPYEIGVIFWGVGPKSDVFIKLINFF